MPRPGGPGPMGPWSGGIPANSTMTTANQWRDFIKTTRNPMHIGGGGGYAAPSAFSFISFRHKLGLAWDLSYHTRGNTRIKSFIGNYQFLGHGQERFARFNKVVGDLEKRMKEEKITPQHYGERIMYEAMSYYGYMRDKTIISRDEYYQMVEDFAESKNIDFSWGEEAPSRSR